MKIIGAVGLSVRVSDAEIIVQVGHYQPVTVEIQEIHPRCIALFVAGILAESYSLAAAVTVHQCL